MKPSKIIKSDHSPSFAADQIGGNEDLTREILLRVPSRSLLRFKSVSKQWRSLIEDPQFPKEHTSRRNPSSFIPSGIYFYNSLTNSQQVDSVSLRKIGATLPPLRLPSWTLSDSKIKITQSCHGLYLIRFVFQEDRYTQHYGISNITTGQFKMLQLPDFNANESMALAYDPAKSPHYKVVCVKTITPISSALLKHSRLEIKIYSSETDNWSVANICGQIGYHGVLHGGVYLNGAIHWVYGDRTRFHFYNFDVEAEKMLSVVIPPNSEDGLPIKYFGEYNGHLHLVYGTKTCNVFEMDGNTLKWSIKYRVDITPLFLVFPEMVLRGKSLRCGVKGLEYLFSVLCVVRGEKQEDSALVLAIPGKVICYNFTNNKVAVLSEVPYQVADTSPSESVSAFPFVETLYPI